MAANPTQAKTTDKTATIDLVVGAIEVTAPDGSKDKIKVGNNGKVWWDTASGTSIEWWAVVMKGATPFADGCGSFGDKAGKKAGGAISSNANGGGVKGYEYTVYAWDGGTLHELDPEVEVGPPGHGGP